MENSETPDVESTIVLSQQQALMFYGVESSKPFEINGNLANIGDMLRHAREYRKISVELLSDKLNLDPNILRQLESNRYQNLAGETFIKGYLSLIARELGADSEPLLKVYEIQKSKTRLDSQITATFNSKQHWTERHSFLIIIFVLALATAVYYISYFNEIPKSKSVAEKQLDDISHGTLNTSESGSIERPIDYSTPPPISKTQITDERLLIRAREGTWIEIVDNLGVVLFRDLISPNQTLELLGRPPYNLIIGSGDAVDIEFRGEIVRRNLRVDQSGVVRLQVGNF